MSIVRFFPRAEQDLIEIYAYSVKAWGQDQADRYLDGLYARIEKAAGRKELWRTIPSEFDVSGYFVRYRQHILYFAELSGGDIGVVTVLHEAMHQGHHLEAAFAVLDDDAPPPTPGELGQKNE